MSLIWTQSNLEPKRKFRFLITFSNFADIRFLAQTCDRPGIKVAAAEHKYFDKTYHHPGRVTWDPNPLSIKLIDIQKGPGSSVDTTGNLLELFKASGLQYFASESDFRTIGKDRAVRALGKVTVKVLNSLTDANGFIPPGAEISDPSAGASTGVSEVWELDNAWLESIKPDSLDYSSDDLLTVTIQVRYDFAFFTDGTGLKTDFIG